MPGKVNGRHSTGSGLTANPVGRFELRSVSIEPWSRPDASTLFTHEVRTRHVFAPDAAAERAAAKAESEPTAMTRSQCVTLSGGRDAALPNDAHRTKR